MGANPSRGRKPSDTIPNRDRQPTDTIPNRGRQPTDNAPSRRRKPADTNTRVAHAFHSRYARPGGTVRTSPATQPRAFVTGLAPSARIMSPGSRPALGLSNPAPSRAVSAVPSRGRQPTDTISNRGRQPSGNAPSRRRKPADTNARVAHAFHSRYARPGGMDVQISGNAIAPLCHWACAQCSDLCHRARARRLVHPTQPHPEP